MSEYQIRKIERDTIFLKSDIAYLDPEHFRDIEYNPYTGDGSKEDFLNYLCEVSSDWDFLPQFEDASCTTYFSEEEVQEALSKGEIDQEEANRVLKSLKITGVFDELSKIMGNSVEMEQYASSSEKYQDASLEIGVEDASYKKTGGFNGEHIANI